MKHAPQYRGILAVVAPYTIAGPPSGIAYLLGKLKQNGINDIGFVDLRIGGPEWLSLTYNAMGSSSEHFVFDVPDLPLVLHFLRRQGAPDVWNDFEELPWVRSYCQSRSLSPVLLGHTLRRTQAWLARWASTLDRPAIVGFSVWISNYLTTLMAAAELKRLPDPPFIVLGGPQCTDSENAADLALGSRLVDAVVVGEGEQTFLELQAQIDPVTHTLFGPTPAGTKIWRNGAVEFGGPRKLFHIDDLPLPNYDSMDLDIYSRKIRQISYELSRGCTDKCEFCSEWVFWEHFRSSTPVTAVNQLLELQRRTGYGSVTFSDSLLNGSANRLVGFAEHLLTTNLQFLWSGFVRADITKPVAKLLSRAGLDHVFIGVESLSDRTLLSMKKRRDGADNVDAIEAFLDAGISVAAGVIAGFPGDSAADFEATVNGLQSFLKRYPKKFQVSIEPFVVTPSATIAKRPGEFGLTLVPWEEEIIDWVPELASITRRCIARAEGADQSHERTRRYHYATDHLYAPGASDPSLVPACEWAPPQALRAVPLDKEWVLLIGNDLNTREAWLLRADEANDLPSAPTSEVLEDLYGAKQIRWNSLLAPAAGARGITFELAQVLGLHPCVVARRCEETNRLIVMNLDTELFYRFNSNSAILAEFLSTDMRSLDEIVNLKDELSMTSDKLRSTLSEWWAKRLLMGTPKLTPAVPETDFTQLKRQILSNQ